MFFIFNPTNILATDFNKKLSANGTILMNLDTGEILYNHNIHKALPPASTTKVLTFLVTMDHCNLDDMVSIGPNPPNVIGSAIGLKYGEIMSINDLLHGLLMESGNDVAVALAEHISGSEYEFVKLMNQKADEIGCTDSTFKNCTGLYESGHVMSAYDLSLITSAALKYTIFSEICSTVMYKLSPTNLVIKDRYLNLGNKMLQTFSPKYYPYAIAGKTGYTTESLYSYTAVSKKDNMTLVCCILNDPSSNYYDEVQDLFEYGFEHYSLEKVFSKGDIIFRFPKNNKYSEIISPNDFYWLKKSGFPFNFVLDLPNNIKTSSINGKIIINNYTEKSIQLTVNQTLILSKNKKSIKSFSNAIAISIIFTIFILKFLFFIFKMRCSHRKCKKIN